jgi:hypothetical protein
MEPELAHKIEKLINDGAIVVGNGFTGSPGLNNFATANNEIRAISERLFGAFGAKDAMEKNVRNVGKGKVYCSYSVQEALEMENISKDIEVLNNEKDVAWIHRNDGNEHYYFIVNRSATSRPVQLSLRVNGMQPEIWDPITGKTSNALVWESNNDRTTVSLNMEANGSCFVVFRNKSKSTSGVIKAIAKEQIIEPEKILLNNDWDVRFQEKRGAPSWAHFENLFHGLYTPIPLLNSFQEPLITRKHSGLLPNN